MVEPIHLIVGLGNPGAEYAATRHNAGAWFVELLAKQSNTSLKPERKFSGSIARVNIDGIECRLFIPSTYMNVSGQAVQALSRFYKIPVEQILVAHDELDFPPGTARLKQGGGHGGHNGLRDIIQHLGSRDFYRLRIGIGHPGDRRHVHDYVLHAPSRSDEKAILKSIDDALAVVPDIVSGHFEKAMRYLHG